MRQSEGTRPLKKIDKALLRLRQCPKAVKERPEGMDYRTYAALRKNINRARKLYLRGDIPGGRRVTIGTSKKN